MTKNVGRVSQWFGALSASPLSNLPPAGEATASESTVEAEGSPVGPVDRDGEMPDAAALGEGRLVLLVAPGDKRYLIRLRAGAKLHTHLGIYAHDDLIGQTYGTVVHSQMEQPALLLEPGLGDLMTHLKRGTQIIYPKDAAYLTFRLNLRAGARVVEAGTGSGGLTMALAWAVAPSGQVYTYEARPETAELAQANLARVQLDPFVTFHQRSIETGFEETGVDALFLDVREPWRFLEHAHDTLKSGGFLAGLVPTTNQVSGLVDGLERNGFVEISVEELLLRTYKPVPERLRPNDMMIGHTGFLVFARSTQLGKMGTRWQSKERRRYLGRRKMEEAEAQRSAEGGAKYPKLPLP